VLAGSRKIAADSTEKLHTVEGAKTARHLLLDFHHAQIAFRQIIIERNGEVMDEVEYGVAVTVEALEQFASGTLSDAPLARLRRKGEIS